MINWENIQFFGVSIKDFSWELNWIVLAVFIAIVGTIYYLYVCLFGKMALSKREKKEAKEMGKSLKRAKRADRREALRGKKRAFKRVVRWKLCVKKILMPFACIFLAIAMVFVPVWDATGEVILESLFPSNKGNADSESARLAMGESRENVVTLEKEGMVLLKNENDALPLDVTVNKKVNLFGAATFGMLYGGGGSGCFVTNATVYGNELYATRLEKAMETEGFEYNPYLYNLVANYYESNSYKVTATNYDIQCQLNVYGCWLDGKQVVKPTCLPEDHEAGLAAYTKTYSELGGKTLLEQAKEYSDVAIYTIGRAGGEDIDLFQRQVKLTKEEGEVINMLKENFGTVIILLNSSNALEVSVLENEGIDAVLWVGHPGLTGATAIAQAISGKVNPSGKLVDTWARSAADNPAALMFGRENAYLYKNGGAFQIYYEGVYVGYRYYTTRAMTDPTFKYEDNVIWSFGYGLSYTTFEKHITEHEVKDGVVSMQVAVTNTGDVAGKEVVEIYAAAPYTGKIEKPYYELVGFTKTDVIEPGETYYARVEYDVEDMSSWDSSAVNGLGAYVLEKGTYTISLRDDVWQQTVSEEGETEFTYEVESDIRYTTDSTTGTALMNQFSEIEYGPNASAVTYLSRKNWTGTYPTATKINTTPGTNLSLNAQVDNKDYQLSGKAITTYGAKNGITLDQLAGKDYNDPMWEKLLDQMTLQEQFDLVDKGRMGTSAVASCGKIENYDDDGPASIQLIGVGHVSEVVLASTWNIECARLFGKSVGKEGAAMGMTGWYAPGLNTHRTAMGGRNFEYYSEDPLLSGLMGGYTMLGADEFGVFCYLKHYALNDQETNRSNIQVWANEQSIREIYCRSFEIAIKTAAKSGVKAMGVMTAFTCIGSTWSGASYALTTQLLRNEWGFKGTVITDWVNNTTMPTSLGLRAGNDLWLGRNGSYDAKKAYNSAPHDMSILLRNACHNILYSNANSNAVWTEAQFEAVGIKDMNRYHSQERP